MSILLVFLSCPYAAALYSNRSDLMQEETQGARTLPEGLRGPFEGAGTHLRSASTPQSANPLLQGASTPLRGASSLVQVANTTPQGASTPLPLVVSSPIVAQLTATRSPSFLMAKLRKRERLENFFKGKARTAYRLSPELNGSLSRSDTLLPEVATIEGTGERCQRGCTEILTQLVDIFHAVGRHNAKTQAAYDKSYPKEGDYINVSGKSIVRCCR